LRKTIAFTSKKFLVGQKDFLLSKGKTVPAMVFAALIFTRPIWSLMLPPPHQKK
jgi:hypothetical protein